MFTTTLRVPYFGLGADGAVKTKEIVEALQEVAAEHADSLGIGVDGLLRRGLTWVLRRYRAELEPTDLRELELSTWYEPFKDLHSTREMQASADGRVVARAWSSWILLDVERGRPVRLSRGLPQLYFDNAEPTGERHDEHLPSGSEAEKSFMVRASELDRNSHVNNTVYLEWAVESTPIETASSMRLAAIEAEYLSPVRRETVTTKTTEISSEPKKFAHSIFTPDGTEAARVMTVWTERA